MRGRIEALHGGFGFIASDDKRSRFFHKSALVGLRWHELENGMEVDFAPEEGPKGPRAAEVVVVSS